MIKYSRLICGIILSLGISLGISFAAYAGTYGVVTGNSVNVRAYNEIDASNRLFQVSRGQTVEIHGIAGDFFRATIMGTQNVYISREWVQIHRTVGRVVVPFAWAYDLPSQEGGSAAYVLPEGATLAVVSSFENWYGVEINDSVAFVEKNNIETPDFVYSLPVARFGNTLAEIIIERAKELLGTRYVWGGTTPNGFDCSGFMVYLMRPHGIVLNRASRDMARNGVFVPRNELEPGDLVFFGTGGAAVSHVGLYIGRGYFIHSSSFGRGVIISHLSTAYNTRNFVTARRVLPE